MRRGRPIARRSAKAIARDAELEASRQEREQLDSPDRGAARGYGRTACVIDGCTRAHLARGWCLVHYGRWKDHGSPTWEPPATLPRVEVECPHCGRVAVRFGSQVRDRGAKFCSYACRDAARAIRPKKCKACGTEFIPKGSNRIRFCSRACLHDYSRRQVALVCAECGTEFLRVAAWSRGSGPFYCRRNCADMARRRPGSRAWRGSGWPVIAAAIRERDCYRCVRCGSTNGNGSELSVDHIIPWLMVGHDEAKANDPTNLASLCLHCHGVKTFRVEPRMARGDFVSLVEFYGPERANAALSCAPFIMVDE